jgi:Protein of unknown function (DUF2738)
MDPIITWKAFDADQMLFADVKTLPVEGMNVRRVDIKYAYEATTQQKFSFKTPKLFSWGVSAKQQPTVNGVSGAITYRLPLVMHEKDALPTADEAGTIDMCEQIKERCKKHLRDNKLVKKKLIDEIEFFLWPRDKETDALIPGAPPTMYPKLKTLFVKERRAGQTPAISTGFYTAANKRIADPLTLEKKRCYVRAHIVVDNIYIGADKAIIQLKVQDVIVVQRIEPKQMIFAEPEDAQYAAAEEDEDDAEIASIFKKVAAVHGGDGGGDEYDDGFALARGSGGGRRQKRSAAMDDDDDDVDQVMLAAAAKMPRGDQRG